MKTPYIAISSLVGAAMLAVPISANAQVVNIGEEIFQTRCAVCHNTDGKGSGPFAGELTQKVPDLTVLQKNNGGVFPFQRVYEMIDGQQAVAAHGTREMPIWGNYFNDQAPEMTAPFGTEADYALFVRNRILGLIGYLSTIQVQ